MSPVLQLRLVHVQDLKGNMLLQYDDPTKTIDKHMSELYGVDDSGHV